MSTSVFIFMAGDNNLDIAGRKDIRDEMLRADLAGDFNLVLQVDRRAPLPWEDDPCEWRTRRYLIRNREKQVLADLGETNTGDPATLRHFLQWGMNAFPADRNIVIIWGHGGGSKNLEAPSLDPDRLSRWVARDDSSGDALDNLELKSALSGLPRRLDILAFDTCLMSVFEVVYQLRDCVDYIIASQEIEPADGWPYHHVLTHLSQNQQARVPELCKGIVRFYGAAYAHTDKHVTQSAIATHCCDVLGEAVDALAAVLRQHLPTIRLELYDILSLTQKFKDREYIDLRDFANLCMKNLGQPDIREAAETLIHTLSAAILINLRKGDSVKNAHGLSTFFPLHRLSKSEVLDYAALDIHRHYRHWLSLVEEFYAPKKTLIR